MRSASLQKAICPHLRRRVFDSEFCLESHTQDIAVNLQYLSKVFIIAIIANMALTVSCKFWQVFGPAKITNKQLSSFCPFFFSLPVYLHDNQSLRPVLLKLAPGTCFARCLMSLCDSAKQSI
mmetsp:Transcript_11524/g.20340  ORF Transcript_11524/g.20340 Transcript_11524/m.20340 type:complete len:122 (-) Transcript_11524:32-397(-)